MPHIHIISWPISDEEKTKKLLEEITTVVNKTLGCPLDKISISIQEVLPSRWADAGIVGNDPDFVTKSRLILDKDINNEAN